MWKRITAVGNDLRSIPKAGVWLTAFSATGFLLGVASLVMPDFIDLAAMPGGGEFLVIAAVALVLPAFCEEVVFRGLLNRSQSAISIGLSTVAFVVWHPLEAILFLPEAQVYFTEVRFLFFVACFGVLFCLLRRWGRSLWPPIICHWMVVAVWKGLGGAQFLTH